jgi:cytoskeleton protein RodZ
MADVATRLRSAREQAGLTIEDVASRTKISPVALRAIERGEFERLPGEFFARAFLRSYARELRLPVDEVMAEYDAARPAPTLRDDKAPQRHALTQFDEITEALRRFRIRRVSSTWSVAALSIVVIAVTFAVNRPERPRDVEPRPVGTTGGAPVMPEPAPPAAPFKLRLEIHPSRPLWVTGHADGKRVIFRTIEPGAPVVVEGTSELSFRVGDAGAFEFTLNGLTGKPPGRAGEVREFRITRNNYREFAR